MVSTSTTRNWTSPVWPSHCSNIRESSIPYSKLTGKGEDIGAAEESYPPIFIPEFCWGTVVNTFLKKRMRNETFLMYSVNGPDYSSPNTLIINVAEKSRSISIVAMDRSNQTNPQKMRVIEKTPTPFLNRAWFKE